jgi:hypothetical protein
MFVVLFNPCAPSAWADFIVTPNALAATEGNDSVIVAPLLAVRFMQIIDKSQFASLQGSPLLITSFAERPDAAQLGPATAMGAGTQIYLSTTSKTVSTMDSVFSANIGSDYTLVRTLGATDSLSTANLAGPGNTKQFDVVFHLTQPFLYDPSAGSLLVDFHIPISSLSSGVSFIDDAFFDSSPNAPGRVVRAIGDQNALTGDVIPMGKVLQFTGSVVPEPSTIALASLGALCLFGYACRRRKLAEEAGC